MQTLHIPAQPCAHQVPLGQIIRVESLSNYSKVYSTHARPFVVSKVLHWFEDQLPPELFARVHRSHLINRQFIANRPAHTSVLLQNGDLIPVSRRKQGAVG